MGPISKKANPKCMMHCKECGGKQCGPLPHTESTIPTTLNPVFQKHKSWQSWCSPNAHLWRKAQILFDVERNWLCVPTYTWNWKHLVAASGHFLSQRKDEADARGKQSCHHYEETKPEPWCTQDQGWVCLQVPQLCEPIFLLLQRPTRAGLLFLTPEDTAWIQRFGHRKGVCKSHALNHSIGSNEEE